MTKIISENNSILSITNVGSFLKKKNFSDIDIVVIVDNLERKTFKKIKKKLKEIQLKKYNLRKKIFINDTFGPLKYNNKENLVIHLMIYSIKDHLNHTIESPLTCLDWERNKSLYGMNLREIFPVSKILKSDFYNKNRSFITYKKNLSKNVINYKKYYFKNNKIFVKNLSHKINYKNTIELCYHIYKFLCINYLKFKNQKNKLFSDKQILIFLRKFDKIYDNYNYLTYINLSKYKINNKSKINANELKNTTLKFINNFEKFLKLEFKNCSKIIFKRHLKTSYDEKIFIGQKLNPNIIKDKSGKNLKKLDISYTSPSKRAIETSRIFSKKHYVNSNLKEIDYGLAEGLNFNQLKNIYPEIIDAWRKKQDIKFPKGENNKMVLIRVKKFKNFLIKKIRKKKNYKILVVSHNIFLRCLIGNYFNLPISDWYKIKIRYGDEIGFNILNNKFYLDMTRYKLLRLLKRIYEDSNSFNF